MRRVVITGLGIVSPIGNNADEVLASLKAGRSGISASAEMAEHGFRSRVAGAVKLDVADHVDKRTLRFMGPGAAYSYIAMQQAIADAGLEEDQVVNPMTGEVIESLHELRGVSFAGKILVSPGAKGSSGWSGVFHTTRLTGKAPLGLLFTVTTTKAALGAVVLRVPSMTDFDRDPVALIASGDWVRIDADAGEVQVWKDGRP